MTHTKDEALVQPEYCDPSSTVYKLAEMVMSDCGCSSNNQRLLDRIAERIQRHIDAATPPAAQRQWVPVTKELLSAQHPWLYESMWIAVKDGSVMTGHYAWMQGRYPDRFLVGDCASLWAFEATHVMPMNQPKHPLKETMEEEQA
jgi:hypothetical protein